MGALEKMPSGLVWNDLAEYSLVDDLTGEELDPWLVTAAKYEEVVQMYSRRVWDEKTLEECKQKTGEPPIPVRWVCTNKGNKLHPNVRCRLVAKRLVAKYEARMLKISL